MACCGKTPPLGSKSAKKTTTQKTAQKGTTSEQTKKVSRTPTASSFQQFTLERRDGTTQTFGSRLEAEAERIRSGGGGTVR